MSHKPIDWSQLWYPGPKRAFTAEELARAGGEGPSRTFIAMAAINFATIAFVVLETAPAGHTARLTGALIALAALATAAVRWLWWRPWRRPLMQAQVGLATAMVLGALLIRWRLPERADRESLALALSVGCATLIVLMWFLVVWRAQDIGARLAEQAEREKAIEMARRLAAAQLEPHFLFNTLASAQHWVQTKDDRAGDLLAALTGYLRATLPLFNRPLLALGEELQAVEHYLQVMQLRMGARMRWSVDVAAEVRRLQLPPGVLLTLVENAIQHGLEPRIAGGELRIEARTDGSTALLDVLDNGAGPPPGAADGTGLANIRERLQLAMGPAARFELTATEGGGCRARLHLPMEPRT
jgi:hypothetical protein